MAWEELLRLHDKREDGASSPLDGEKQDKNSLIHRAGALIGPLDDALSAPPAGNGGPVRCADGYLRRSPVQPYRTPEGYERRRLRRIVLTVLGICAAALLAYALLRAGMLRFR